MSTIFRNSHFEEDAAPLVSLEGVDVDFTSHKQEERQFTRDELPLLTYTSAPVHPFTERTSHHPVSTSWEKEHWNSKESQRNSEGAVKSRLRGLLPMYQSNTGSQSLNTTSPPWHAFYERIPSPRMIGRRHNLMLKRGEKNPPNERFTPKGSPPKGKKYQRMFSDGSPKCEDEEEVEDEECKAEGVGEDSIFVSKNCNRSGSLPAAFTFAPYQSF